MPLFDLRHILVDPAPALDPGRAASGEALRERDTDERVAAQILRRHALRELLPAALVERHLAGDVSVLELGAPHRMLTTSVPIELLSRAGRQATARGTCSRSSVRWSAAAPTAWCSRGAGPTLQTLLDRGRGGSALAPWLSGLTAAARAGRTAHGPVVHRPARSRGPSDRPALEARGRPVRRWRPDPSRRACSSTAPS